MLDGPGQRRMVSCLPTSSANSLSLSLNYVVFPLGSRLNSPNQRVAAKRKKVTDNGSPAYAMTMSPKSLRRSPANPASLGSLADREGRLAEDLSNGFSEPATRCQ